mgnify:CR=1 FL=1
MFKKFFFISFLIYFFNILPLQSDDKVTFLNLDAVLNNSKIGKTIVQQLSELKENNSKNFNIEREKIKKREEDLIAKQNILSKEEFNSKLSDLKKEIDIFNKEKNIKIIDYEKLKKKELDKFIKRTTPLIENYTIDNSISLVVNQKNIFIGNKKYDITRDIIDLVEPLLEKFPSDKELIRITERALRALSPDGWRGGADDPNENGQNRNFDLKGNS